MKVGGGGRTRTSDTGLMRPLLYHLSYTARASDMVGLASTTVKQADTLEARSREGADAI